MKEILFRMLARCYFTYRALVSSSSLKMQTLALLKKFHQELERNNEESLKSVKIEGKWSASEISCHAFDATASIFRKLDRLRKGEEVRDLERSSMGVTRICSREDLLDLSSQVLKQVEAADFTYAQSQKFAHPLFGPMDLKTWLVLNLVHLERHYSQMERALSR